MSSISLQVAVTTVLSLLFHRLSNLPRIRTNSSALEAPLCLDCHTCCRCLAIDSNPSGQKDHPGFLHLPLIESCQLGPSVSKKFKLTKQSGTHLLTQREQIRRSKYSTLNLPVYEIQTVAKICWLSLHLRNCLNS